MIDLARHFDEVARNVVQLGILRCARQNLMRLLLQKLDLFANHLQFVEGCVLDLCLGGLQCLNQLFQVTSLSSCRSIRVKN